MTSSRLKRVIVRKKEAGREKPKMKRIQACSTAPEIAINNKLPIAVTHNREIPYQTTGPQCHL